MKLEIGNLRPNKKWALLLCVRLYFFFQISFRFAGDWYLHVSAVLLHQLVQPNDMHCFLLTAVSHHKKQLLENAPDHVLQLGLASVVERVARESFGFIPFLELVKKTFVCSVGLVIVEVRLERKRS